MTETHAATATRQTETRHRTDGKTCHHFYYHGLTCDEFDHLRARAAGHCELCGTPEAETGGKRLVVDHFHGSERRLYFVRGLLCDKCNVVMSCLDEHKPWGANRVMEARARVFEANSWQQPTAEQWKLVEQIRQRRRTQREEMRTVA